MATAASIGAHSPAHDDRTMKSGLIAPLILILLGLFFLASNLGWTDASLGRLIATWWPAILIAVGAIMLIDRSKH